MKKQRKTSLYISIGMLIAFIVWTILICYADVKAIGPLESCVGFATINSYIHNLTGVNFLLYEITDLLSLIPLGFIVGFAILGLYQFIKRKSIFKVDYSILVLGGFYIVVMAAYLLFEVMVINYRPVMIKGVLETSYPSSTTMLVMTVMPAAIIQLNSRIKRVAIRKTVASVMSVYTVIMVVLRLVSGVHWFTDIVGGVLLSIGLVTLYYYANSKGAQK